VRCARSISSLLVSVLVSAGNAAVVNGGMNGARPTRSIRRRMRQTFYVVGGSVGAHRLYRPRMGVSESHDVKKGIVVTGENPIVSTPDIAVRATRCRQS
jgi:hypothetical protein